MASITGSVWAIDIGSNSLKALRLTDVNGVVEAIDFDNIEHNKILTGKGVEDREKEELIAITLRQFVQNHDIDKDDVIVSLPSQNSFARFVNLPPVESKKIPEIIRFEAVQQIPFDINDVQWDWQLMEEEKGGEKKVGIFAIKNDIINYMLDHFSRENIQVRLVQMIPMALYNYAIYDRSDLAGASDNQGIIVLNIGAEYSDLVICTKSIVWQRCIPMGGNSFTKAISDAFKINFEKAEKLKRNATTSKYARQILQAMKPVFSEFANEIQRSIVFYSSSNPNTKLIKIVAIGGGTKMRGLLKYLQQSIQMPIERPESFEKLATGQDVPAAKLHDNICDLGVAYGLGIQALGLGKIESNLLPRAISRSMMWAGKSKYFITAAALLLMVSVLSFGRVLFDKASYRSRNSLRQDVTYIISRARTASENLKKEQDREPVSKAMMQKEFDIFDYRQVIAELMQDILSTLPNEKSNPGQSELYEAFKAGDVQKILLTKRNERKQIFITGMTIAFSPDIPAAGFDEQDLSMRESITTTRVNTAADSRERARLAQEELMKKYNAGQNITREQQTVTEEETATPVNRETQAVESKSGFVVTIVGYSPYKDYEQLLDPPDVGADTQKWGFVTRLKNLKTIVDGNCPFEIYNVTDRKHFDLIKDVVALDKALPAGIGIEDQKVIKHKNRTQNTAAPTPYGTQRFASMSQETIEKILLDPMTKEIISREQKYNEDGSPVIDKNTGKPYYEINDHWFQLKLKFTWKNTPEEIQALTGKK
jgi:type IV pilus assembly protein PilM